MPVIMYELKGLVLGVGLELFFLDDHLAVSCYFLLLGERTTNRNCCVFCFLMRLK